jgi:hypothetical protein
MTIMRIVAIAFFWMLLVDIICLGAGFALGAAAGTALIVGVGLAFVLAVRATGVAIKAARP